MNTHNTILHNRGFISVAALLIMMASLSVVMAIVYRSAQGGVITRNLKQSNQAYQEGDNNVEQLIQKIQAIDNDEDATNPFHNRIPDSILANNVCAGVGQCYTLPPPGVTGTTPANPNTVLRDIIQVSGSGKSATTERSLQIPIPERVLIPPINHPTDPSSSGLLVVEDPVGSGHVVISWKALSTYNSDLTESAKIAQYNKLEVRRADITSASSTDQEALLKDASLQWKIVGSRVDARDSISGPTSFGISVPADTTYIEDNTVEAGKTYAYIIKATNKNPLKLDSYYSLPKILPL